MKKKNITKLCMRYSESCKLCPRSKKCEEELKKENQNKSEVRKTKNSVVGGGG